MQSGRRAVTATALTLQLPPTSSTKCATVSEQERQPGSAPSHIQRACCAVWGVHQPASLAHGSSVSGALCGTHARAHARRHMLWSGSRIPSYMPHAIRAVDFPWVEGASNAQITSADRHFAQRYRHASAQHCRSVEERNLLLAEVIHLFNGLEEREASIVAAMQQLPAAAASSIAAVGSSELRPPGGVGFAGGGSAAEARDGSCGMAAPGLGVGGSNGQASSGLLALLAAGEGKLLDIELSRLKLIHAQASRLLSKRLPALS